MWKLNVGSFQCLGYIFSQYKSQAQDQSGFEAFLVQQTFILLFRRDRYGLKLQALCGYSGFFSLRKCTVNYWFLTYPDSMVATTEM